MAGAAAIGVYTNWDKIKGVAGKAKDAVAPPDAPNASPQPTAKDASASIPDSTRRRIQLARQRDANSTILTAPGGVVLGNDASAQRSTLLGS